MVAAVVAVDAVTVLTVAAPFAVFPKRSLSKEFFSLLLIIELS